MAPSRQRPTTISLGSGLELPIDAATESFGIMGQRGSGKSNTAVVMAEDMFDAEVPWVAVDPKGDWHGIRSSADGKSPGLPVPVFGGLHGDFPLEPAAGIVVADLLVDKNITAVLDVSRFSGGELGRFLVDFCHRLFRRHQEDPHVRHVFYEEAHRYIPQMVTSATAAMKEACAKIPLEGRAFGLGSSAPTQRPARLHKDITTQFSTLVVGRIMAKQDRDAIGGWFDEQSVGKEALGTLQNLNPGEMWVLSPLLGIFEQITVRRRRTFDSGATPKVGQAKRRPATLADIDSAAIKEALAETIEKVKADDPKELRKRIRSLERQLAERPTPEVVVEVEVPVLAEDLVVRLEEALTPASTLLAHVQDLLAYDTGDDGDGRITYRRVLRDGGADLPRAGTAGLSRREVEGHALAAPAAVAPVVPIPAAAKRAAKRADPPSGRDDGVPSVPRAASGAVTGMARDVLVALAQHGPLTKPKLAIIIGKSAKGGYFARVLGQLRTSGWVTDAWPVAITAAGEDALGSWDPLPTGQALVDYWLGEVAGMGADMLKAMLDAWPNVLSKAELGEAIGKEPSGGYFARVLGRLRGLGLVEGLAPARALVEAANL